MSLRGFRYLICIVFFMMFSPVESADKIKIEVRIDDPYFTLASKDSADVLEERLCLMHKCSTGTGPFVYPPYCNKKIRKNAEKYDIRTGKYRKIKEKACDYNNIKTDIKYGDVKQNYFFPYPIEPNIEWDPYYLLYYGGKFRPNSSGYNDTISRISVILRVPAEAKGKACAWLITKGSADVEVVQFFDKCSEVKRTYRYNTDYKVYFFHDKLLKHVTEENILSHKSDAIERELRFSAVTIVAMGDSYSSGEGNPHAFSENNAKLARWVDTKCDRSLINFSSIAAQISAINNRDTPNK